MRKVKTHPEVCVAVHHHGPFDQLIGTLEQMVAGHHTGVVDQQVHFANLPPHPLCCGVHALSLPHINHICVHLWLERRDLFYTSNSSFGGTDRMRITGASHLQSGLNAKLLVGCNGSFYYGSFIRGSSKCINKSLATIVKALI